jgi:hypothetical protein
LSHRSYRQPAPISDTRHPDGFVLKLYLFFIASWIAAFIIALWLAPLGLLFSLSCASVMAYGDPSRPLVFQREGSDPDSNPITKKADRDLEMPYAGQRKMIQSENIGGVANYRRSQFRLSCGAKASLRVKRL